MHFFQTESIFNLCRTGLFSFSPRRPTSSAVRAAVNWSYRRAAEVTSRCSIHHSVCLHFRIPHVQAGASSATYQKTLTLPICSWGGGGDRIAEDWNTTEHSTCTERGVPPEPCSTSSDRGRGNNLSAGSTVTSLLSMWNWSIKRPPLLLLLLTWYTTPQESVGYITGLCKT